MAAPRLVPTQATAGPAMNVIIRWVLDTFSDTPSAVDYLKRIPHHEGISYLVADKAGASPV